MRGGIDLGGTKIEAIVVDKENQVRGSSREPTPTDGGPAGVAAQMVKVLREAAAAAEVKPGDLEGVGVGSPGDVNRLILYLLEGTDFATGAVYRVDGGRFLGVESGSDV